MILKSKGSLEGGEKTKGTACQCIVPTRITCRYEEYSSVLLRVNVLYQDKRIAENKQTERKLRGNVF